MGKASTKHFNQRKIPLPSFPLGIDWSQNPESIPDGALVQAENCEYNHATGALRTCPGVTIKLDHGATVASGFKDAVNGVHLFSSGQKLYKTDFITTTEIGDLSGASKPVYCPFDDEILIASGGKLQIWTGLALETVLTSPDCVFVAERESRAMVFGYTNRIDMSGIRDARNWTENTEMDAVFNEIGDGAKIIAVDTAASDLVIYKENSTKRMKGIYPNWQVLPGPKASHCMSYRSVTSVGNDSFFIGYNGFLKVRPTDGYDDVAPFEEGLNVNAWLVQNIDANAEIYHIPNRKQMLIKTQNDKGVYIYHYLPRYPDGRGAFTHRAFTHQISDVWTDGDQVFVAYGNKIGILDSETDKDDGQQIVTEIASKRFMPERLFIIVKYMKLTAFTVLPGNGTITVGQGDAIPLIFNSTGQDVFGNTADVFGNTTSVVSSDYSEHVEYGGGSNENMQIVFKISEGAVEIRALNLDVAEV
jgi:hypothetical protein